MKRDFVEELFKDPRPTTIRGVWRLTRTYDGGGANSWAAPSLTQALEMARHHGCPRVGVESLQLHGFFDAGEVTWKLVQELDAGGRRPV